MDWREVGKTVRDVAGKAAPIVGTLLGGPAGAKVGALVASVLGTDNDPAAVHQALVSSPDAAVKLAGIESDKELGLKKLLVESANNELVADTNRLISVNTTMQAESKAEHWPTYSWRPFIGFVCGTMAFGVYFILPLLEIPVPDVPTQVWVMFMAILGVAAWHRGSMQVQKIKKNLES